MLELGRPASSSWRHRPSAENSQGNFPRSVKVVIPSSPKISPVVFSAERLHQLGADVKSGTYTDDNLHAVVGMAKCRATLADRSCCVVHQVLESIGKAY